MCRLLTWKQGSSFTCVSSSDLSMSPMSVGVGGPERAWGHGVSLYTQYHCNIITGKPSDQMFLFLSFFILLPLQGFEKSRGKGQNRSAKLKRASVGIQGTRRLSKYYLGGYSLETVPQEINLKWTGSKGNWRVIRNQVHELRGQEKLRQSHRAGRGKGLVILV